MIHEIFPHKLNNEYLADANIQEGDFLLYFSGKNILLKTDGHKFEIPKKKDFPALSGKADHTFLFTFNDTLCFLLWEEPENISSPFEFLDIGFFRSVSQFEIAWICLVGFHLAEWYRDNKFCGKCGSEMKKSTAERAINCHTCHTAVYPKISPAIIVAILSNNKILLARNSNFRGNWYSLIAGFADIGESLEQTIIREVKEEVGLDVANIRYYKSQPWPLSGSMMIGYIADGDENQPITIDGKEITEAGWFTRENLPDHPSTLSIAGEMIEKFQKGELI